MFFFIWRETKYYMEVWDFKKVCVGATFSDSHPQEMGVP